MRFVSKTYPQTENSKCQGFCLTSTTFWSEGSKVSQLSFVLREESDEFVKKLTQVTPEISILTAPLGFVIDTQFLVAKEYKPRREQRVARRYCFGIVWSCSGHLSQNQKIHKKQLQRSALCDQKSPVDLEKTYILRKKVRMKREEKKKVRRDNEGVKKSKKKRVDRWKKQSSCLDSARAG